VELISAFLALSLFTIEGLSPRFFFYYYFTLALTVIAFTDLEHMVIMDICLYPTFILGLIIAVASPNPLLTGEYIWDILSNKGWPRPLISLTGAVFGTVVGFLCLYVVSKGYELWRGKKGLGDGDPLLLGMIGSFLGWYAIFPVLFFSSFIALLAVVVLVASKKFPTDGGDSKVGFIPVPYGPFLSLAAVMWLFYGQSVTNWYFSLMR
jgi:leader peptidase (prepilin peptidase)/N-methyltransferase